jgi:serine/threonine protein kinase, bacterial
MNPTLLNSRYRVIRTLGRGGFGETFLAQDTHMPSGRHCVIKLLKPSDSSDPQVMQLVRERFAREAAILEELGEGSSQIPNLFAYFSEAGQFYLVQEWIEGLTLGNRIATQGPMSDREVAALLDRLLPVLDYVHSKRIVHRDIKPDNIILRQSDGMPVLIDFGAVRETMATAISTGGNVTKSIVIGTPGFMSGEQAAGRPTYSSDLYSLGLTAIYALTGKMPQELPTDPGTGALLWQPQVLGIDPRLAAVLDKAVEPHPRDRYASVAQMQAALHGQAAPSYPASPTYQPTYQPTVPVAPGYPSQTPPPSVVPTQAAIPQKSGNGTAVAGAIAILAIGAATAIGIALAVSQSRSPTPDAPITQAPPSPTPTPEIPTPEPEPIPSIPSPTPTPTPTPTPSAEPPSPSPSPVESFYFLGDSAFKNAGNAKQQLDRLKDSGYSGAGAFWMPDYPNLSRQKYTQVYVEKFADLDSCLQLLETYGRENREAYCALASTDPQAPLQQVYAKDVVREEEEKSSKSDKTIDRPSPEQMVRDYFATIDNGEYRSAWDMLSQPLQQDSRLHPNGYADYFQWWNSVDFVELEEVTPIDIEGESASVLTRLKYHMKSGNVSPQTLQIDLVWDEKSGRWLYDNGKVL